jgi:hypothetical protein
MLDGQGSNLNYLFMILFPSKPIYIVTILTYFKQFLILNLSADWLNDFLTLHTTRWSRCWGKRVWCGAGDGWPQGGLLDLPLVRATHSSPTALTEKPDAFRVTCIDRVHYANVFRIGSMIHREILRVRICRLFFFLVGILSVSVDSTLCLLCEWNT